MWKSGNRQEKGVVDRRFVSGSFPDFHIPHLRIGSVASFLLFLVRFGKWRVV
jgi:hypothetical protein